MAIGRAIGNLLGGVSQQPENTRFANMAEESVNTYASLTQGLDKRRPSIHLSDLANDSTVNSLFHALKRSPTEQYGLYIYRKTNAKVFAKAVNLQSGADVPIMKSTWESEAANEAAQQIDEDSLAAYFSTTGELVDFDDGIDAMTVADTTFVLNRNRVVTKGTAPDKKFEDKPASLQIAAGYAGSRYSVTLDGMEFFYRTPQSGASFPVGHMWKTEYIAARLVYGAYDEDKGDSADSDYRNFVPWDGTPNATEQTWNPSNTVDGISHPYTQAFYNGYGHAGGSGPGRARCYGLIQSGKCTHFIHTRRSTRPGDDSEYNSGVASDQDASANKSKFRLYGDNSKWASGTTLKIAVEYYDTSDNEWKKAETSDIAFNSGLTTSAIATALQTAIQGLSGPTLSTAITVAAVSSKWWDYEITLDASASGDSLIRNIYVSASTYRVAEGKTRYTVRLNGNHIAIMKWGYGAADDERDASHAMELEVEDEQGNNAVRVAHVSSTDFADLPNLALDGQVVRVTGSQEDGTDDYFVKFVADINAVESGRNEGGCWGQHFVKGRWNESTLNENKESIDANTMPPVFLSKVGAASGNPVGISEGDPYFVYQPFDYAARDIGDAETNKTPSFVGNSISGMTYHRGRLGFMSGESLALSEAAAPGNFYRTTVSLLRDTDRIDITARVPKVSILRSAFEMNENLILFSDQTQFMLTTGGGPLSPASAGLDLLSSYESTSDVTPVVSGFNAYFPYSRGLYSGMYRYYPAGGAANLFSAEDITAQAPNYIKGRVRMTAVSDMEKVLAVVTEDKDTIYIYKWSDIGDRRVQSAWFKWELTPTKVTVSGTEYGTIRGVQILDSTVYIIRNSPASNTESEYTKDVYLEKIELEDGVLDIADTATTEDVWYVARLDRRLPSESMTSVSYSAPHTTVTINPSLNVKYEGGTHVDLVYRHGVGGQVGGYRVTGTVDGSAGTYSNVIKFGGDHTGKKFYIGKSYTMQHTLSAPYIDGGQSGALITGRVQVRRAVVDVAGAGAFSAEVTPTGRTKASDFHPSKDYGEEITADLEPLEKSFTVPIYQGLASMSLTSSMTLHTRLGSSTLSTKQPTTHGVEGLAEIDVNLRKSTRDDCFDIGRRLRRDDYLELRYTYGMDADPGWVLDQERLARPDETFTLVIEGDIVGMGGCPECQPGVGVPWFMGTKEINKYKLTFHHTAKLILRYWKGEYALLSNLVWDGAKSKVWLERLGFAMNPEISHVTESGGAFRRFYMSGDANECAQLPQHSSACKQSAQ